MPGISGVTVVTVTAGVAFFLPARLRAHWAPGIPCALILRGEGFLAHPGRNRAAGMRSYVPSSFRGDAKHRTRNLEIPGLVRSLSSGGAKAPTRWDHPGMTVSRLFENRIPTLP